MNPKQIENFYPLALAVRRLFHRMGHGATVLHRESGISAGMRAVLESVIHGGPMTVPQMARVRPVSRQHIQGLANALLDAGLVEYVENPAHRRSKLVAPTQAGRSAYAALRAREAEAFGNLPLGCTADEIAAATATLRKLLAALESPEWRAIIGETQDETEN